MKRKGFTTILVMALIIVILAATALAVGLSRSPRHSAAVIAREAIMEKYGITLDTIGLLYSSVNGDDQAATVTFSPIKYNNEAIGTYTVTVKDGKAAGVTWSNDDVDPALYASGTLDAPAWGQKQLEKVQEIDRAYYTSQAGTDWLETQRWTLEQWAEHDKILAEADALGLNVWMRRIAPGADDIQEADALQMAKDAILKKYGATEDELAKLTVIRSFIKYDEKDEPEYRFGFGVVLSEDPGTVRTHYMVEIASPSGKVLACMSYVPPEERTLPEGSLAPYEKAVEEYIKQGAFDLLSPAEKAALAARIVEAKLPGYRTYELYAAPEAGDLPEAEILTLADKAMADTFGVTDEGLTLFESRLSLLRNDEERVWLVTYTPNEKPKRYWLEEKLGSYTVSLAANTGEVLDTNWASPGQNAGKTYTQSTWGEAKAYDAGMLPWIVSLLDAVEPYRVEIDRAVLVDDASLELYAAHDQLFRDNGFSALQFSYGVPGEGDLTEEAAAEIARQVLREEYQLTDAVIESCILRTMYYVYDTDPMWEFQLFFTDGRQDYYIVRMDAKTGVILYTDYAATGNG